MELSDIRQALWYADGDHEFRNRTEQWKQNKFDEMEATGHQFHRELDIDYWRQRTQEVWMENEPESPEEIHEYYANHEEYIPELHFWNTLNVGWIREQIQFMNDHNVETVLDYGAGVGDHVLAFNEFGFDPTYLDIDGVLSDHFKTRCEKRNTPIPIELITEPGYDLRDSRSVGEVDAILSIEVLEHVPDPIRVIDSWTETLSDDGVLITSWTFDDYEGKDNITNPTHINTGMSMSRRVLDHLRESYSLEVDVFNTTMRMWRKDES